MKDKKDTALYFICFKIRVYHVVMSFKDAWRHNIYNSQLIDYTFTFLHISLKVGDTFLACTFVDLHVHWLIDLFSFFSQKNNKQKMSPIILALVPFEYII